MSDTPGIVDRLRELVGLSEGEGRSPESIDDPHDDYKIDDASLCEALHDDLREDIAKLGNARGQTSAGVVKAAITTLRDRYEGRLIEFDNRDYARSYYRRNRESELEFDGALDELTPEGYYDQAAQPVRTALERGRAEHREKANTAARWLDTNDPDTRVVEDDHGSPVTVPELDADIEPQHGTEEADEEVEA